MPRIALLVDYVGRDFHGSQYQTGLRTVQSELEHACSTYFREPIRIHLSGRTDRGVHAAGLVVHFDLSEGASAAKRDSGMAASAGDADANGAPDTSGSGDAPPNHASTDASTAASGEPRSSLDLWRMCWGLNGILKRDVSVCKAQIVSTEFHARFSASSREYVYRILNCRQRSALLKDTHHFVAFALDLDAMKQAARAVVGTHDFIAFRSTNADKSSTICKVSRAELLNLGEGRLEFWIAADHFVYNMVRIIVGSLIEVGLGKKAPESLEKALIERDRNLAGPTAPSWGLTLNSVKYPEAYMLFEQDSLESRPGERS